MDKERVLFITQEVQPFLPKSVISAGLRQLTQATQDSGREIRVFMPRFGCINERRHQLHEVIRLSGMNIVIDDTDHPLIIKVASVPQARMQVYFIDNEEFFHRKAFLKDKSGSYFEDNDERMMFFSRGVLETVKKLGWKPDVIHCHGWFASLLPLYVKSIYKEDPHFADTKVVFTAYELGSDVQLSDRFNEKLAFEGFSQEDVDLLKAGTHNSLHLSALKHSDAVVLGQENLDGELLSAVESSGKPTIGPDDEQALISAHSEFYTKVLAEEQVAE